MRFSINKEHVMFWIEFNINDDNDLYIMKCVDELNKVKQLLGNRTGTIYKLPVFSNKTIIDMCLKLVRDKDLKMSLLNINNEYICFRLISKLIVYSRGNYEVVEY